MSPVYRKPVTGDGATPIMSALGSVPVGASTLTQDNIFPHVCGRADAYVILPDTRQDPETQARARRLMDELRPDYVLVDLDADPLGTEAEAALAAEQTGAYTLVKGRSGLRLYRLAAPHRLSGSPP